MRGEKSPFLIPLTVSLGSPPHARGKVVDTVLAAVGAGITPACAGKSSP